MAKKKAATRRSLKFHPLAEAYRLMEGEEFQQLVDDIREHGLLEAIVLHEGKILDGRNRYRACGEASTEPNTVEWSGECGSPEAFVLAKHTRRNVTKGQHAMAVARIFPEGGRLGPGQRDPAATTVLNTVISSAYVKHARSVLRDAPDLADSVTAGVVALNVAYVETRERRRAASGEESRLKRLTEQHPELAELVEQGELTLAGAEAEAKERDARERQARSAVLDFFVMTAKQITSYGNDRFMETATRYMSDAAFRRDLNKDLDKHLPGMVTTKDRRTAVATGAKKFIQLLNQMEK